MLVSRSKNKTGIVTINNKTVKFKITDKKGYSSRAFPNIEVSHSFYNILKERALLKPILAHEKGHQMTTNIAISFGFPILLLILVYFSLITRESVLFSSVISFITCLICLLLINRYVVEYRCDEYAAKLTSPGLVIKALQLTESLITEEAWIKKLHHPPIKKRIGRLEKLNEFF